MSSLVLRSCVFIATVAAAVSPLAAADVFDLGDRRELFVDRHQIESMTDGATLRMHQPRPAEIALKFDAPWEGPTSAYVTVFQDGDKVRMYYRGSGAPGDDGKLNQQYACYAESTDGGRTFVKPKLGLVEVNGSKDNNVIWGTPSHNFTAFKDTRPGVPADERYKALKDGRSKAGKRGLYAYYSADGLAWRQASDDAVLTQGAFDSQNLAFWDEAKQKYCSYYRVFTNGVRDIALATSDDFQTWSDPVLIKQSGDERQEQFYTNATTSYFRAPQYYFCFPKRFVKDRSGLEGFKGISDAKFLSSRDGEHFDRTFMEAFIRPGSDQNNWGDRGTMPAWGLVQTGPDEMSIYYSQHYRHPTAHMRRGVLRLDGIASLHADGAVGELVTKPLTFAGQTLTLNYATSAAGSVQVEIQNADGSSIPGFTLAEAPEAFGDKIDAPFAWKKGSDVSSLAGKPVRLRFVVRDADVYSYRFAN